MNYTIHEIDNEGMKHEHVTSLEKVPYYLLDEWATTYQFDPIQEARETSLGTYCIFDEGAPTSNLMKTKEDTNGLWNMFFDGSRNKNGSSAGVVDT